MALVVVALATGGGVVGASESGAPIPQDEMFGVGPSGSGPVLPDCPDGTYVYLAEGAEPICQPLDGTPEGTIPLAVDAECPVSDLSRAFTQSSEMKTLVECVLPTAINWMTYEYEASVTPPVEWESASGTLLPLHFLFVPAGVEVVEPSDDIRHCGGYDSKNTLQYCSQDGNIYLGEEALADQYFEIGDGFVWAVLGHEMGHRVQHVANAHLSMSDNEAIPKENQADCFAGAFVDFATRYHHMNTTSTGQDLIDMFDGLFAIGENVNFGQTHGTRDQRVRAFFVGYNSDDNQGAWTCDAYLTDITIVPISPESISGPSETEPTTVPGGVAESSSEDELLTCDVLLSFGEDIVDEGVTECDAETQAVFDSIMTEQGPDAFDDFVSDDRVREALSGVSDTNGQAYLWGVIACFDLSDQPASSAESDYVGFFMEKLPSTTEADAQAVFSGARTYLCPNESDPGLPNDSTTKAGSRW
jgi:Putative neutral zinc metallopeptidase